MKVGREEIVGLITALRRYAAGSDEADTKRWRDLLASVAAPLAGLSHIALTRMFEPARPVPALWLDLDEAALGFGAYDEVNRLLAGEPAIAVGEGRAEFGTLIVLPQGLTPAEADTVGARLRIVLAGGA